MLCILRLELYTVYGIHPKETDIFYNFVKVKLTFYEKKRKS